MSTSHRWIDAFNFLPRNRRTSVWGWALLVIGLAAMTNVGERWQQLDAEVQEHQVALQRLQRAAQQQRLSNGPASNGAQAFNSWDAETQKQAHRVLQQLAFPWPDVLEQVEQAALQEGVLMLSLSADTNAASQSAGGVPIRLSGAVTDDASAISWAQSLGDSAQLVERAPLTTRVMAAKGELRWRADVSWVRGMP